MRKHESRGITLVALIITVVIMLILAGVVINLSLGENGIFQRTEKGAEIYQDSANQEGVELSNLEKEMEDIIKGEKQLPQNTEQTEAGTKVEMPSNWYSNTPSYVAKENGVEVVKTTKIASVEAISDGKANTIPVPIGFYYVGGTLNTGVVISDQKKDQNKYAGQEVVPAGAIYNANGMLKEETELTEEEKRIAILGNQFVWIPCTEQNYTKYDFGLKNCTGYDTTTNTTEIVQIEKYGGFYIGRYEAGTSQITFEGGATLETPTGTSGGQNEKYTAAKASGKITTRAGEIPYYHASYTTAIEKAKEMYQTQTVQSVLMTGTMWDATMKYLSEKNDYSDLKNTTWGNYNTNTGLQYEAGRGRYININSSTGVESGSFTKADTTYHYGIRTTGFSDSTRKKNIYDLAGNLWEWTQETANITNNANLLYVPRGGCYNSSYTGYPICCRGSNVINATNTGAGFRPALYIK